MESSADMAGGVAIDVASNVASDVASDMASDMAGDISSTAHEWMGPIQSGALSWA